MEGWNISASAHSQNTNNPIRETVSNIILPPDFPKPTYSLALGDPSVYEDFEVHEEAVKSVQNLLSSGKGNGYINSMGPPDVREFLAQRFSYDNIKLTGEDVIMDVGGSGAIHTVMQAFLNPGDNILIPSPGFPLYNTISGNLSAETRYYRLVPESNWEIDFEQLSSLVDSKTKLLVIVNPSNPCGTVFSREHLLEILNWAQEHKVCILADEVYNGMTYGKKHYPLGSLTEEVPVFSVTALSKMFLVPGWRCGWTMIYDKLNLCKQIRESIFKVKNMLLHPVPFICKAVPEIFQNLPDNYIESVMEKVKERAELVYSKVQNIPGLSMAMPEGALYCLVMVEQSAFRDIASSKEFAEKLAREQGVLVMPAEAFMSQGAFRVVLCHPKRVLEECLSRIQEFVSSHLS